MMPNGVSRVFYNKPTAAAAAGLLTMTSLTHLDWFL